MRRDRRRTWAENRARMKFLSVSRTAVFVKIVEQLMPNGLAVVSQRRLGALTGLSERQVRRVVDWLIDEKWVWIEVAATTSAPPAYGVVDIPASWVSRGDILTGQIVPPNSRSAAHSGSHVFPTERRRVGASSARRPPIQLTVIDPDDLYVMASKRIHALNGHDP